jgi:GTP-binding protein EngB required for normal cell division
LIVATKSDKLSNNELRKNIDRAKRVLESNGILPFSTVTGRGREETWHAIEGALKRSAAK